jgi:tripartite ATP-independent transporter DctM subunit
LVTTATGRAFFALLMPAIMLGGIYSGVFTPTEAAAVALVYTLPVGFLIYKGLTLSTMSQAILRGACDTASIIIVLFVLFTMSRAMVLEQVPGHLADMLLSISENKYAILFMINVLLLLIGMLVDDVSGSILAAVILMPIVQKIGVDPIHFAAIVGVNLGLGNVSPPCAPLLYMAGTVSKTPLHEYVGPTMKFLLLGHLPIVFVVTFIPEIALFLPNMVFGG